MPKRFCQLLKDDMDAEFRHTEMESRASTRKPCARFPPNRLSRQHLLGTSLITAERKTSMSNVLIERVQQLGTEEKPPVFAQLEKTIEKIQQRAFSLFEQRGGLPGLDWDDWLLAEHDVLGASSAELRESNKELTLRIAVPGLESKDVTVTATPEVLIVQATSRHSHSAADGDIRFLRV
jgi:HSP20 family molecular chaperone IbpA